MRVEHIHNRITQQYDLIKLITGAYKNFIKVGLNNISEEQIDVSIEALHETWDKFSINHDAINIAITRVELSDRLDILKRTYFCDELFVSTQGCFVDVESKMSCLRNKSRESSIAQSTCSSHHQAPRLPRIYVLKFDGNLDNWLPFCDMFTFLVLSNVAISSVEKLQYLKTSCVGAAHMLRNTPLTAENFVKTWDSVCDYYNNDRMLVNSAIQGLFSIEKMTRESFSEMELLYTSILQVIRIFKPCVGPLINGTICWFT